jgi:hypothetical protein
MESILMASNQSYRKPASAVITLPDPDFAYADILAEKGGTLEIRCESPNSPTFHVVFAGDNPSDKEEGHVFEGSIHQPVVIPLLKEGDFRYDVTHFHLHRGEPIIWHIRIHILPCNGCPGSNQGSPPGKK